MAHVAGRPAAACPSPGTSARSLIGWGFSLVVMSAEKDLGSSLLFFTLFVVMLWVATERASYLVIGAVLFAAGAYVAVAAVRPRAAPRRRSGSTRGPTRRARATRSSRRSSPSPAAA